VSLDQRTGDAKGGADDETNEGARPPVFDNDLKVSVLDVIAA